MIQDVFRFRRLSHWSVCAYFNILEHFLAFEGWYADGKGGGYEGRHKRLTPTDLALHRVRDRKVRSRAGLPVEFPGIWPYSKEADTFVRHI